MRRSTQQYLGFLLGRTHHSYDRRNRDFSGRSLHALKHCSMHIPRHNTAGSSLTPFVTWKAYLEKPNKSWSILQRHVLYCFANHDHDWRLKTTTGSITGQPILMISPKTCLPPSRTFCAHHCEKNCWGLCWCRLAWNVFWHDHINRWKKHLPSGYRPVAIKC